MVAWPVLFLLASTGASKPDPTQQPPPVPPAPQLQWSSPCSAPNPNSYTESTSVAEAYQFGTQWIQKVEERDCTTSTGVTCTENGAWMTFKFAPGQFSLSRQILLQPFTRIEGHANPNDATDPRKKPEKENAGQNQTYFVASLDSSVEGYQGGSCEADYNTVKYLRPGFLMNSNTQVVNINFQGIMAPNSFESLLCGGGAFETPGCITHYSSDSAGKDQGFLCQSGYDGKYRNDVTGNGEHAENVLVANVRLNDMVTTTRQARASEASMLVFWSGMAQDRKPHKNIRFKNVYSLTSGKDGFNIHGAVDGFTGEDLYVEYPSDDAYAIWGTGGCRTGIEPATNVRLTRAVAWYPENYGSYGSCVATYGAGNVTIEQFKGCAHDNHGSYAPFMGDSLVNMGSGCGCCQDYSRGGTLTLKELRWESYDGTHDICQGVGAPASNRRLVGNRENLPSNYKVDDTDAACGKSPTRVELI